jgi:two-component system response regulator HydG
MLEVINRHLSAMDYYVFQTSNVPDAIEVLKNTTIDLLISDLQMPEINGMQLINYCQEHFPEMATLVITGYPSVSGAVEAVKSGVLDYLVKPFTQEELKNVVENALSNSDGSNQVGQNSEIPQSFRANFGMVGASEKMQKLAELINRVKDTKVTVLVQGESGTGKELVARAIHYTGKFAKSPFVAVNCGGIPENLLESELFGFVKGSFTGANDTRAGFFQAADGGSIFLDEIGNASLTVQTRLLRALQEKEITMIGSTVAQKIDVRIIAATNSHLMDMVKDGTFREDLYYRLNVVNIEMPPLRERQEDIPILVRYFIRKYVDEFNKSKITMDDKALAILQRHSWPGNIRELENVVQRAIIMCENVIEVQDLPDFLKLSEPTIDQSTALSKTLKEIEKEHILKVLNFVKGNKSKAAEILEIDRKTLRQKLL